MTYEQYKEEISRLGRSVFNKVDVLSSVSKMQQLHAKYPQYTKMWTEEITQQIKDQERKVEQALKKFK